MAVRVGVIGLGFMGRTHLDIHLNNPRAEVTAYCDFDPNRTKGNLSTGGGNVGTTKQLNIDPAKVKAYNDPNELIADPNVDAVDICLPTYMHAEIAIKALNAGKYVLCEKPLTVDLKEADRIVAAAKKSKAFIMPAHCMRFWPEWTWLKQAIVSKEFGKIHSATFKRFAAAPGWSAKNWILNPKLSGAALFDLHIHDADFVRFAFGDPQAVFSVGNGGKSTRDGIDHVVTSYLFKNPKLVVVAEGGWNADTSYPFTMRYTAVFDKATADFDASREGKVLMLHRAGEKEGEVVKVSSQNGWQLEIDYFLECIEKKKKPKTITVQDARESIAMVHAEAKSVRERKIVKL